MSTRILAVALAALFLASPISSWPQAAADGGAIACRALEVHTDDVLKVAAIVFHQRDEAQPPQLGALLREHSGEMVEVQANDGVWRRARLARLKSCFGRGLLFLAAPAPFTDRAEFMLRLPAGK